MTISEAQKMVHQWITSTGVKYFSPLTNMAILTEEVGEVARCMARTHGDQSFKNHESEINMADELADVMWVLFAIANQNNIDLQEAMTQNFEKKNKRDSERHHQNKKLQ